MIRKRKGKTVEQSLGGDEENASALGFYFSINVF